MKIKRRVIPAAAGNLLLSLYINDETRESTLVEQLVVGWEVNQFSAGTIVWGPRSSMAEAADIVPWDVVLEIPDGRCIDNSQNKTYPNRATWLNHTSTAYMMERENPEDPEDM